MAREGSISPRPPRGGIGWDPPPRPRRLRSLLKRGRAALTGGARPRPAPPPAIPPGWETAPPDFVGVGVQRAATSFWFRLLCSHPGVSVAPGAAKEIHMFDRLAVAPEGALEAGGGDLGELYARHFPRAPGTLAGEWTPCYMAEFWAPALLRRAAPEARLLVILRDPIDRYASAIARYRRKERELGRPLQPADLAVSAERSLYSRQLERLFDAFPRERVLILQYERFAEHAAAELERTWEFLGLEAAPVPEALFAERVNHAGSHAPVGENELAALVGYLAADVARLPALAPEIDLGLWEAWAEAGGPARA